MSLEEEIEIVNNKIESLEILREQLEEKLLESKSILEEKLQVLINSDLGIDEGGLPNKVKYPLLNNFIDNNVERFHRGATYEIKDLLEEEFKMVISGKPVDWYTEEDYQFYYKLAQEIVATKIKSFTFDW